METMGFYAKLGFQHVLDPAGYDHVLFLLALALPFTFRQWKRVFWLATLFTLAHCFSLALAAYDWVSVPAEWVEFLIPLTILLTALANLLRSGIRGSRQPDFRGQLAVTAAFGLIHGLGFSNYFHMLMSGESAKATSLVGFALGIEAAQLLVLTAALSITWVAVERAGVPAKAYIRALSTVIAGISVWLLIRTWPL